MAALVFSKVIGKLQTRGLIAIGVAVLALVVAVWFLASSNGSAQPKNAAADGSVMVGAKLQVVDGAAIKDGTAANSAPVIEIYTDFSCAGCREFASANDDQMRQWANNGLANLNYHVVVSAAEPKKHDFALRAANADFCALDSQPNKFFDATSALMRMQISAPSFPTDDAIESTLKAAGVQTGGAVHDCIVSKSLRVS
jgi:protein-disulfide isomerase